jgi:hypothetical protein
VTGPGEVGFQVTVIVFPAAISTPVPGLEIGFSKEAIAPRAALSAKAALKKRMIAESDQEDF